MKQLRWGIALVAALLALSVGRMERAAAQDGGLPLPAELDPAPVVEWMELLRERVHAEVVNAPAASRLYAYAGVTVYESLVGGMPSYRSLAFQVNGLIDLPFPEAPIDTYDWLSVANGALSTTLNGLMFEASQETHDAFNTLRQSQADARTQAVGQAAVMRSMALGDQIAKGLLNWVNADGYRDARQMNLDYRLPTADMFGLAPAGDYLYVQTDTSIPLAEPYWGTIRPFGIASPYDCYVTNNMFFSTDPESAFYQQAMEVFEVGNDLTAEQREIAEFWIDTPGESSTPAGHWVSIMNQLTVQLDLTLQDSAMMYGMVGMVLGDSFITAWSQKYEELLLRPVTYINRHISRSWRSYLVTPQFPEYPSGHSVVSAAAADMLTNLLGIVPFTDETHLADTGVVRSFMSFEQAADEAAISRLYGGIHYRTAIENGKRMGRCIAAQTLDNIVMQPLAQGE
jgi:hypothetical protein